MPFSPENRKSYSRLQAAIGRLLEGHSYAIAVSEEGGSPLLVLEDLGDAVGFAIVNGSLGADFDTAYATFKQLYRQRHTTWQERNLSFVVCRSDQDTTKDAYFNSIETDVYFCRKYVVRLPNDDETLRRELLRLPFLPIPEDRSGGIVRPPSAQTLLQSLGVSASLARQIIVPGKYSASTIVNDVSVQTTTLPPIEELADPLPLNEVERTHQTRIKSITIDAFRAYRRSMEFDLDADVVVLYGPNGLGKTSFFDAIDYVCTGRIGRLCRQRVSQERFIDLARHLATSTDQGSVAMVISRESITSQLSRRVVDWSHCLVDGDKRDRTSTLQFLTSADWVQGKQRVENLESLFRATHLFSQSAPELLAEFEKDSTLSADLVSRTLALEDYASGRAKVGGVLDALNKHIKEGNEQLKVLKNDCEAVQDRIKSLPGTQDSVQVGQQLKSMAEALVKDLRAEAGVTVDGTDVTVEAAHEWRAVIEAALRGAREQLAQLQVLESGFEQFEKDQATLRVRTDQLSLLNRELQRYDAERKRLEEEKNQLLGERKRSKIVLDDARAKRRDLGVLYDLQHSAHENQVAGQQGREMLRRLESEAAALAGELYESLSNCEALATRVSTARESVQVKSQRHQTLCDLENGFGPWERAREEASKLQEVVASIQSGNEKLGESIDACQRHIEALTRELRANKQEYERVAGNQAELTRLLDELEGHIRDGVCPTCGADYKNKGTLIERVHAQKEARPAHMGDLAQRGHEIRKSLEERKASIASLILELDSRKRELGELSMKLAAERKSAAVFENYLEQAGFSAADLEIRPTVSRLLAEETIALQVAQGNLATLKIEEANLASHIKELKRKQSEEKDSRKLVTDAIEPLEEQLGVLRSKAEELGFSLEMDSTQLASEQEMWAAREAEAERQFSALAPKEESLKQAAAKAESDFEGATALAKAHLEEKEALERELGHYKERAKGIAELDVFGLDHLIEQRIRTAERVVILEKLTRQALTLERALDAAQRSAMLAELESRLQESRRKEQGIEESTQRMSEAKKWFSKISDILDKQNSGAVANHVRAFGPLTTLIQNRLRAVYGFGDVNLLASGNEIRVEVDWEGKNVKPTDYFSDSQKQILSVSLFLAGRLTQTWSGFAAILMDDPVTHFDDLNSFGFVELIRGLVSVSPGERQFLISTCDERLFELLMKKLGNIEGGTKFYRFEGIGADGPIVSKLAHRNGVMQYL